MKASGLQAQIAWLQQPLGESTNNAKLNRLIPAEWRDAVNQTIADAIKPATVEQQLRSQLAKNLSQRELKAVQVFYESTSGRAVVAVESGKGAIFSAIDSKTGANTDITDRLAQASGYGNAVATLARYALNDAVDLAIKQGCFGLDEYPFAAVLAGIVKQSQSAALAEKIDRVVRQRYSTLSATEQADYLAFANSSAGRKFLQARQQTLANIAQQTGESLNTPLAQQIMALCKVEKFLKAG